MTGAPASAPLTADVCIVGGGLVGCSTALHLARDGLRVVLMERDSVGSRASGVNFGGVRRHGRHPAELSLAIRSRALWGRMAELVGLDCEFLPSGHLKLALEAADMADLEAWLPVGRDHGIPVEVLGRAALRRRFPWLADAAAGASFCPDDGQANPRLAGPAFARAAVRAGAVIRQGAAVTAVESAGAGFVVQAADGAEVRAAVVVNAAGAWAATLAAHHSEPVPLVPVAPQMFVSEPAPYVIEPAFGMVGGALYLRQIPRGNVIFGGGRGVVSGDGLVSRPVADVFRDTVSLAGRLVPHLRGLPVIRSWTGIEGNMPDGLPVVGPSDTRAGLFHAFGFSGHGFQMAPAVGAVLADLIVRGATETDITAFRIGRFASAGAEATAAAEAAGR